MPSLRYFYLISFLLLIVGFSAAIIFSFSYVENNILKSSVTSTAKVTAEKFHNSIWRKYRKPLAYLPCDRRCPKTGNLTQEFTEFKLLAEKASVISFRLFNENAIETLNKEKTFSDYHPAAAEEKLFSMVMQGGQHSEIVKDYKSGSKSYTAVRALFPIEPLFTLEKGAAPQNSVVEIYYDITPIWTQPNMLKFVAIGIFVTILSVIFGIMYMMTSRGEQILAKQHETNVDLATAAASAEKESKEKSQFLANVSHELRTPLNAIIGFSEIIKDEVMGPLNNQQYKDYIGDIYISGVHLLSLINDILDYSKAEAGKLTVDLADVDVTKIMKNSLRLVTPRANEANVELVGEVPKKHYILHTDGKRLKQVLLNLFSNAVKFTPSGGTVTLYAWHNLTENMFVIEVKDTGVGIAPKDISKVMATFGQVENKLSRKYEGTGLGLPLSNKLVELMSGKLEIKSELGSGTTVSISLPYIEEQGTGTYNEMDALKGQDIKAPEDKPSIEPAAPIVAAQQIPAEPVAAPTSSAPTPEDNTLLATPAAEDKPESATMPNAEHPLPPMHVDKPKKPMQGEPIRITAAPTPEAKHIAMPASFSDTPESDTNEPTEEPDQPQPVVMRGSMDDSTSIEMPSSFSTIEEPDDTASKLDITGNPATTAEADSGKSDAITMSAPPSEDNKA